MATLNRAGAEAAARAGVRGATDVTGFGLLGHAASLARESRVTLELVAEALPLLPAARDLALRFQPGGLKANAAPVRARASTCAPTWTRPPRPAVRSPDLGRPAAGRPRPPRWLRLLAALPGARRVGRVIPAAELPLQVV